MVKRGIIYKIENLIDGKVYIGQTTVGFKQRVYSHKYQLERNVHKNEHLQRAWKKYGRKNFRFSVMEHCSILEIDEREKKWIEIYDSTNRKKGYNFESGGHKNKTLHKETRGKLSNKAKEFALSPLGKEVIKKRALKNSGVNHYSAKKVICINDKKVFGTINKAADYYDISQSDISAVCRGARLTVKGLQFAYYKEGKEYSLKELPPNTGSYSPVAVKVICKNDGKVFGSMVEAAGYYGVSKKAICKVCKGERISCFSKKYQQYLQFAYYEEGKKYKLKKNKGLHKMQSIVLTNTGEVFESAGKAAKKYNLSQGSISSCCSGKIKSAGKLPNGEYSVWVYEDEYDKNKDYSFHRHLGSHNPRAKKVICLTTGEVFETMREAGEKYNISGKGSKISLACTGKRKHVGKLQDGTPLKWAYYED